jgi:hypothetical protein
MVHNETSERDDEESQPERDDEESEMSASVLYASVLCFFGFCRALISERLRFIK